VVAEMLCQDSLTPQVTVRRGPLPGDGSNESIVEQTYSVAGRLFERTTPMWIVARTVAPAGATIRVVGFVANVP
jgi:hypothetical protein